MKEISQDHKAKSWCVQRNKKTGDYLTGYVGRANNDVEELAYTPTVRGKLKFNHIHHGTSSVQLVFTSLTGVTYWMEGKYSDEFFHRVARGEIVMEPDGYYEFTFTFVKKSDKVFMRLI